MVNENTVVYNKSVNKRIKTKIKIKIKEKRERKKGSQLPKNQGRINLNIIIYMRPFSCYNIMSVMNKDNKMFGGDVKEFTKKQHFEVACSDKS